MPTQEEVVAATSHFATQDSSLGFGLQLPSYLASVAEERSFQPIYCPPIHLELAVVHSLVS